MNFSDEQLMLLFTKGQSIAFDELYLRYAKRLASFVGKMTNRQKADVQDLVQDIFIHVASNTSSYKQTTETGYFKNLC